MNVSAVGPTGTTAVTSQIEALRKQVTRLTKELKAEVTSTDDAKTKALKQQLISQQIMMLEARIAALQNQQSQQSQQQVSSTPAPSPAASTTPGRSPSVRSADGAGWQVDVAL